MQYLDYERRQADVQYRDLVARIVTKGTHVETLHGPALMVMQHAMNFDLANGFQIITERSVCRVFGVSQLVSLRASA